MENEHDNMNMNTPTLIKMCFYLLASEFEEIAEE